MPGMNGMGPEGQGSRTGRGLGACAPGSAPPARRGLGRGVLGRGRGFGRGFGGGYGRGRGRGLGRACGSPGVPTPGLGSARLAGAEDIDAEVSAIDAEIEALRSERDALVELRTKPATGEGKG